MESVLTAIRRYIARTAAVAVVVLALVPVAGSLAATGSSVNISPTGHLWPFVPGANGVIVQVTAVCTGGLGTVTVQVSQTAADSGQGVPANGTQSETVNCDGSPQKVAVSVGGTFTFNVGKATATASLSAPSGTATDKRTINIVTT